MYLGFVRHHCIQISIYLPQDQPSFLIQSSYEMIKTGVYTLSYASDQERNSNKCALPLFSYTKRIQIEEPLTLQYTHLISHCCDNDSYDNDLEKNLKCELWITSVSNVLYTKRSNLKNLNQQNTPHPSLWPSSGEEQWKERNFVVIYQENPIGSTLSTHQYPF